MTTIVVLICILVALVGLRYVVTARTRPSQQAVLFSIAAGLSALAFACQVFPNAIDRTIHIVNFSDIGHHVLSLVIMALSLLFVQTLAPPHRVSSKTLWRAGLYSLPLLMLVVVQWLELSGREVESPNDASGWQTLGGTFAFVTIIYNLFLLVGFGILAWQCTVGAKERFENLPALRLGSTLMGVALILMGVSQSLIFVRVFDVSDYQTLTQCYWGVVCFQSVIFSLGLFIPRQINQARTLKLQRDQIMRLDPLWSQLITVFPDVELPSRRMRTPKQVGIATARRFVEIQDCLNRLEIPIEIYDRLTEDPIQGLARYLAGGDHYSSQDQATSADSHPTAEHALGLLPIPSSREAGQAQLLQLADAYQLAVMNTGVLVRKLP